MQKPGKAATYFILFAATLIVLAGMNYYYSISLREKNLISHAKEFTINELDMLNEVVENLTGKDSAALGHFFSSEQGIALTTPQRAFFAFKDQRLIFWTDNRLPMPRDKLPHHLNNTFASYANAYCLNVTKEAGDYIYLGVTILKNHFPYENENLQNTFNPELNLPPEVIVDQEPKGHPVEYQGEPIYHLTIPPNISLTPTQNNTLFSIFLLSLAFLFSALYHGHKNINPFRKNPRLFLLFFTADIILIRILIAYFNFPAFIHHSMLFNPSLLAFNSFFPSLGDMVITALCINAVVLGATIASPISRAKEESSGYLKILTGVTGFIVLLLSIRGITWTLESLVHDSSIMLNLNNLFSIDFYTIAAFLALSLLLASFFLATGRFLDYLHSQSPVYISLTSLIIAIAAYGLALIYLNIPDIPILAGGGAVLFLFLGIRHIIGPLFSSRGALVSLLLFASLITLVLNTHNQQKEQQERKVAAIKAAQKQDPVTESLFMEVEDQIRFDDTLGVLLQEKPLDESLIVSYIMYQYFTGYWDRYHFQTTLCFPHDSLILQPEGYKQRCRDFFNQLISEHGHFTFSNNLFYLDNNPWLSSYIARLYFPRWPEEGRPPVSLYIEMDAKFAPEGLVYPELLIDDKIDRSQIFLGEYSAGRYTEDELISSIGPYNYYITLHNFGIQDQSTSGFFQHNGYSHFYYPVDEQEALVVSRHIPGMGEKLAPFAYVFIFLAISLLISGLIMTPGLLSRVGKDFKTRLQMAFFFIVLATFIIIGVISVVYLKSLNEEKNQSLLQEKAHSILVEMENRLMGRDIASSGETRDINSLMFGLSSTFFTDINIYGLDGNLLGTSRPEIYDAGLMSGRMNNDILRKIRKKGKTVVLQKESMGNLQYSSAYMPFRNHKNQIIAYLNIPYYAKQSELEKEITGFLSTFINLYVILLAIAVFFGLVITGYITRPLNLIKEHMRKIKLGAANEKINLSGYDEIGELVREYNKMIDELERSADLLMRSQRESAWREMAKQVAHEIKNPLTPMKLNIQMLQRSLKDRESRWDDKKVERMTQTLLEQIDNLSTIASEFSSFAKMPTPKPKLITLDEAVKHACDTYNHYDNINISYQNRAGETTVKADFKQLLRAFNNILDNAVQSIPKGKQGIIQVILEQKEKTLRVSVKDNGHGIPLALQSKLFSPSFTTKSAGMGLGLTIVKNIIANWGGKVWFRSAEDRGTTFYVELPLAGEEN